MTKTIRLTKAILAGVIWVVLHIPLDIIIIRAGRTDIAAFAITVQALDVVILSYLVFQIMQYQRHRPWKCVVCDGFGKRHFIPGGTGIGSPICTACLGSGVLWERVAQK
jgi:hypothetical protein